MYIKISDLKYNREELFYDTPVFPYPMIGYNDSGIKKLWKTIKDAILSPFPEEKRRFLRYIETS